MTAPDSISPRRGLAAALLAGLLHGPAEALPISSSAHVAFVGRLASGRRGRRPMDAEMAKSFEVGAHAGTLAGLALGLRREAATVVRGALADPRLTGRAALRIGVGSLPAVVGALTLERPIERRLGGDATIAAGLLAGSLAMTIADRPRANGPAGGTPDGEPGGEPADDGEDDGPTASPSRDRRWEDATLLDALALGTAQTTALWPGVSRSGAVLAAARARGFSRGDAGKISAALAVPAVGGATLLKTCRLARRLRAGTVAPAHLVPLVAVTATSALSGYVAAPLARRTLDGLALWPFALYRAGLAAALAVTGRRWRPAAGPPPPATRP